MQPEDHQRNRPEPGSAALADAIREKKIPSQSLWVDALFERWQEVRKTLDEVVVEIVSENEFSEIEKKYQPHGWFMGYWGLNSFERREPIRNAVYSLIYEELEALLGHMI